MNDLIGVRKVEAEMFQEKYRHHLVLYYIKKVSLLIQDLERQKELPVDSNQLKSLLDFLTIKKREFLHFAEQGVDKPTFDNAINEYVKWHKNNILHSSESTLLDSIGAMILLRDLVVDIDILIENIKYRRVIINELVAYDELQSQLLFDRLKATIDSLIAKIKNVPRYVTEKVTDTVIDNRIARFLFADINKNRDLKKGKKNMDKKAFDLVMIQYTIERLLEIRRIASHLFYEANSSKKTLPRVFEIVAALDIWKKDNLFVDDAELRVDDTVDAILTKGFSHVQNLITRFANHMPPLEEHARGCVTEEDLRAIGDMRDSSLRFVLLHYNNDAPAVSVLALKKFLKQMVIFLPWRDTLLSKSTCAPNDPTFELGDGDVDTFGPESFLTRGGIMAFFSKQRIQGLEFRGVTKVESDGTFAAGIYHFTSVTKLGTYRSYQQAVKAYENASRTVDQSRLMQINQTSNDMYELYMYTYKTYQHLGVFNTSYNAALAYDEAAELYYEHPILNFTNILFGNGVNPNRLTGVQNPLSPADVKFGRRYLMGV